MPTYSPEQVLARPASGAPLWGEGLLAAALWLLGGLFTLAWPDAGRRWPFSEGWALAQFTLGGGLLLLALSYRYWRRGARCMPASGWRCCRCCLRCGRADGQDGVLPVPFSRRRRR
jgi:NitT/TauT family transport system permease protein